MWTNSSRRATKRRSGFGMQSWDSSQRLQVLLGWRSQSWGHVPEPCLAVRQAVPCSSQVARTVLDGCWSDNLVVEKGQLSNRRIALTLERSVETCLPAPMRACAHQNTHGCGSVSDQRGQDINPTRSLCVFRVFIGGWTIVQVALESGFVLAKAIRRCVSELVHFLSLYLRFSLKRLALS